MWTWTELTKSKWNHSAEYYIFLEFILQLLVLSICWNWWRLVSMPLNHRQKTCYKLHVIEWRTVRHWLERLKDILLCNDFCTFLCSLLNFTYWFPLKIPASKWGCIWVLFFPKYTQTLLWPWPSLHILFYFIMHEVMCTYFFFTNAPGIYKQCSGFNRNVQQGDL